MQQAKESFLNLMLWGATIENHLISRGFLKILLNIWFCLELRRDEKLVQETLRSKQRWQTFFFFKEFPVVILVIIAMLNLDFSQNKWYFSVGWQTLWRGRQAHASSRFEREQQIPTSEQRNGSSRCTSRTLPKQQEKAAGTYGAARGGARSAAPPFSQNTGTARDHQRNTVNTASNTGCAPKPTAAFVVRSKAAGLSSQNYLLKAFCTSSVTLPCTQRQR